MLGNLSFVMAQSNAKAAKVLVILATQPLWAALFARVFLSEKVPARTAVAIGVCVAVIVELFWADLSDAAPSELVPVPASAGSTTTTTTSSAEKVYENELVGLVWALVCALAMGASLTTLRHASVVLPGASFGTCIRILLMMPYV